MDETKLTNSDQRIQAWYNVYELCLSLGMDVTDKTGEQAVLDFIARIQELETAAGVVTMQLNPAINPADEPNIVIDRKDIIALAAVLNNPPLEKE